MGSVDYYNEITGVILAGGQGKRIGVDKAMLEVRGMTLFQIMLHALRGVFKNVLIAGNRPDLAANGIPCYPDLYPGSALGGIYTGLLNAKTRYVFIASCDMPFVEPDLIRLIVSFCTEADAVIPGTPEGYECCFACYSSSCLPFIKAMLANKDYKISNLFQYISVQHLGLEGLYPNWKRVMRNINTAEDYLLIQRETDSA